MSNLTRYQLQQNFKAGDTPSEQNFYDIFDSSFNKNDDGLDKLGSTGLKIQASNNSNPKDLILLYEDFINPSPDWAVRLRGESGSWGLEFSLGDNTETDFLIDHNGNVGIGLSNPVAPLSFADTEETKIVLYGNRQTSYYGLGIGNHQLQLFADTSSSDITFGHGSSENFTETMRIKGTGNVGIGTNAPDYTLDVDGATRSTNLYVGQKIGISTHTPTCELDVNGAADISQTLTVGGTTTLNGTVNITGSAFHIGTSGNSDARFSVDANGQVGIGTPATNNSKLEVSGRIKSTNLWATGNVGIGIANSSSYKLEVSGNTYLNGFLGVGGVPSNSYRIKVVGSSYLNGRVGVGVVPSSSYQLEVSGNTHLDGHVNINTATSRAPLSVGGSDNYTQSGGYYDIINQTNTIDHHTSSHDYSLSAYFSHTIAFSSAVIRSDSRIKNILGISDATLDLQTLMRIEVSDYQMKDTVKNSNNVIKKLIAQQVEKVYPEAVSKMTDVIPDIMKKAEVINGWVQLETDLQVGEQVKLILKSGSVICEVKASKENAFLIELSEETKEVFVYGREVDDFRMVDYEAISMLNVSATQELYRQLQLLQERIAILEKPILA